MRKLYDFKNCFCKTVKFKNTCSLYEFLNVNFQIFGKPIEGDERRISLASFQKGNVSSIKTNIESHSLLTDAFFKSDFPKFYAKFYQDIFKIFVGFCFVKFHGNGKKYTCLFIIMCLLVYRLRVSYRKLVIF